MKNTKRKVLGDDVVPTSYQLVFEPDFKTFKFKGIESIKIDVRNKTNKIRLNAAELKIKEASIISDGKTQKAKIRSNEKDEEITILFNDHVKGKAELMINFEGTHNDKLYGFYRSRYMHKGKERHILTTQFEAADARKAFPCFDEPAFKATYDVSFVIDKGLDGISNMPVKKETDIGNGKKLVIFQTTPRMSSYLLYLGIGKFDFTTSKYKKIDFRIVTVEGKGDKTKMAMEFGKRFLDYFESYFGIDFPLPKMDLLAIPDFASGAMENWGAITFREIELLGDENTSTVRKQRIAEVIAHELAHQWFGDLVTMKWWDDLWLNESFATFMAVKAVDSVFPKWEYGLQDSTNIISTALSADQFISTHPINVNVNEPSEIDEIFDRISYEKGGAVLAMLEDYAGNELFRKGLHNYLKKHAYSNATKNDLWEAIAEVVKRNKNDSKFKKVAMDWVNKTGYPIINSNLSKNELILEQKRYLLDYNGKPNDVWPVPVHYTTDKNGNNFIFLDKRSARLKLNGDRYVKLNHRQKGLYRVRYPTEMLDDLGRSIRAKKLSPLDSWGIEKDLFSLAHTSRIKAATYLNFIEDYCFGGDYPLDSSVSAHLNGLSVLLCDNERLLKRVKRLNVRYHKEILKRIGWEEAKDERNVTTLLRSAAIAALGANGDQSVIARAGELFNGYLATGKQLPKNLKGAVYNTIAWNGDDKTYNKLVKLYKKENAPEEKRRFLVALNNFSKPAIIRKALEFSLSKEVRLQDSFIAPAIASSNEYGKTVIWGWTRDNWQGFMKRLSTGTHMLPHFVSCLGVVDDEKTRREIEKFFSKKGNRRKDMERGLNQTLELIDANIRFKRFNGTN